MGRDILRCTPDWDPPSSRNRARLGPERDPEYLDQSVSWTYISKEIAYTAIGSHHKIQVEEVIEKPALLDHWISQDTSQTDAIDIARSW